MLSSAASSLTRRRNSLPFISRSGRPAMLARKSSTVARRGSRPGPGSSGTGRRGALVGGELGDVLAVKDDAAVVDRVDGVAHDQVAEGGLCRRRWVPISTWVSPAATLRLTLWRMVFSSTGRSDLRWKAADLRSCCPSLYMVYS